MSSRCGARSPQAILPFLYPSCLLANGVQPQRPPRVLTQIRHHITESSSSEAKLTRLNPGPSDFSAPRFADKAKLTLHAGGGGNGCISFLREAFVAEGPANGGNGGHGGNIYIQAVHGETSLHKLARKRTIKAEKGRNGQGSSKTGQKGEDFVIAVPVGTVVREIERYDPETEEALLARAARKQRKLLLAESDSPEDIPPLENDYERHKWLLYPGISSSEAKSMVLPRLPRRSRLFHQPAGPIHLDLSRPTPRPILLAAGAVGGLGNPHFVSRETPRPVYATKGERPISIKLELELKLLADVGLVGLPNAGKSTLLRAMSKSRARVGSWAFTTIQPNIGTVVLDNNKGRPIVHSTRRRLRDNDDLPYGMTMEEDTEVVQRTRFTIADIPGLIEGAHLDRGLGIAFLRHVERAGVLAFVIDLSAGNAVRALNALWNEVGQYAQMREEEERDRERDARISWSPDEDVGSASPQPLSGKGGVLMADYPPAPAHDVSGLHIAAKPWFVVATKGDLPETQENFEELRDYLASISKGDRPHPSGVPNAWTKDCAAIPVSAINGHGVDRIVHWIVGLLDE